MAAPHTQRAPAEADMEGSILLVLKVATLKPRFMRDIKGLQLK